MVQSSFKRTKNDTSAALANVFENVAAILAWTSLGRNGKISLPGKKIEIEKFQK